MAKVLTSCIPFNHTVLDLLGIHQLTIPGKTFAEVEGELKRRSIGIYFVNSSKIKLHVSDRYLVTEKWEDDAGSKWFFREVLDQDPDAQEEPVEEESDVIEVPQFLEGQKYIHKMPSGRYILREYKEEEKCLVLEAHTPGLIVWQQLPTSNAKVIEWYRRIETVDRKKVTKGSDVLISKDGEILHAEVKYAGVSTWQFIIDGKVVPMKSEDVFASVYMVPRSKPIITPPEGWVHGRYYAREFQGDEISLRQYRIDGSGVYLELVAASKPQGIIYKMRIGGLWKEQIKEYRPVVLPTNENTEIGDILIWRKENILSRRKVVYMGEKAWQIKKADGQIVWRGVDKITQCAFKWPT